MAEGRLLIINPLGPEVKKITRETALKRNELMIELAHKVVVGYTEPGGMQLKSLQNAEMKISHVGAENKESVE